jgi:apolipoprotein N-acyltransferase
MPVSPGSPHARRIAALLAGVASVAGFAPAGIGVLQLAALALLMAMWITEASPRAAALLGFLYGVGLFGAGVSWAYVSLHEFGMMPAPLAVLATILWCAYLALYPALVGSLQARLELPPAVRALALAPALWVLAEWLRGWVLTGFPWLAAGYSQTDSPLAGFAPVAGVYGVSYALALCAGALAAALVCRGAAARIGAFAFAAAVAATGALLGAIAWTAPVGEPFEAALVQGNIEQSMKFDPARYKTTLETYRRLAHSTPARLVLLPETAIPRLLDLVDADYLDALTQDARASGADIVLGAPFRDRAGNLYNGAVTLGAAPLQFFAKRHLVPLGEFVPPEFGWIVSVLHIPLSDFSRGGPPRPLLAAGQRIAMTICYEDAFGEELIGQLPEATVLGNASNVAWFGDSLAPDQHLQMSRMRSIETGRYMLRSTNTGVTAAIDERGRVLARLPSFTEGVLRVKARAFEGATPYVRYGNAPALAACVLTLLACLIWTLLSANPHREG